MEQTRDELVTTLESLAKKMLAICNQLRDSSSDASLPSPPSDVQSKIDRGECLQCGKVKKGERYRRGLCQADYQRTIVRLNRHELTEEELLSHGLIGPKTVGGRKRSKGRSNTALDDYLGKKEDSSESDKGPRASAIKAIDEAKNQKRDK